MSGSQASASPQHHHSTSLEGTSLQIPSAQRSPSSNSTQGSFDQSKSRTSTRQSGASTRSNYSTWTSASGTSHPAPKPSSLRPYFYPTSGYPVSASILQQAYPGSGYPVSHLHHSYGYPSNSYPCCEVPGVTLGSQPLYPSAEFPGDGVFPGEIDQDDGSAPFINGLDPYPSDPAFFVGGDGASSLPAAGIAYTPGSFDPQYNAGYPV